MLSVYVSIWFGRFILLQIINSKIFSDSSSESSSSEESGDEDFSTFNYHQSNSISNETSTTASGENEKQIKFSVP